MCLEGFGDQFASMPFWREIDPTWNKWIYDMFFLPGINDVFFDNTGCVTRQTSNVKKLVKIKHRYAKYADN